MKKWRCTVCGYIHEGEEPPEQCPVCGAERSRFVLEGADDKAAAHVTPPGQESSSSDSQKWQCTVCGFDHTGATPPETCPVCGSEGRHFHAGDETPSPTLPALSEQDPHDLDQAQRWQCSVCGYIHTGPEPPAKCPVCGADKSQFVLLDAPEEKPVPPEENAAPASEQTPPSNRRQPGAAFLSPYRRWIDLAIEYHAHPIAVHIPNGVLPITVAMIFLAAIFGWPAIGHAAFYNMGFILLSMPVVLFSGYLHWQFKFGGNMTDLFKWKIICGAVVLLLSFILFVWGLISPESTRHPGSLYLLLHFIMLIVAGIAGWLGGKLVFRPKH